MGRKILTTTMGVELDMKQWTAEEKKNLPPKYGCEIIYERATQEQVKDVSVPNDAYIVVYKIEDEIFNDVCRGSKVRIFDLYYDKFGPGSLIKIDWGNGKVNPKLWNYKAPVDKKKRK